MAVNRDVTLTLKVKDAEVTKAQASVDRLKKASDDLNRGSYKYGGRPAVDEAEQQRRLASWLSRELPNYGKTATDALSKVDDAAAAVTGSLDEAAAGGARFAGALGPVGTAIAVDTLAAVAFIAAGIKMAGVVFDLASRTAAYAVEVDLLAEKTGLASTTVVALRQEAERQGRSFADVAAATAVFRKNIGEAAAGSVDARAKLKLLGIDGSRAIYDVNAAFNQAIATIVKAPAGVEQTRAAFAAFGDDGYKLIPFFKSFNGNVGEAIKSVTDLSLVMGDKNTAAAKQFTREYADAKAAVQGLTYTFGRELMPTVSNVINSFTTWIKNNKVTINEWAASTGNLVRGVVNGFKEIIAFVEKYPWLVRGAVAVATYGMSENLMAVGSTIADQGARTAAPRDDAPWSVSHSKQTDNADSAALEAARAKTEQMRQEREKAAQAELAAQISLYEQSATSLGKSYDDAFTKLADALRETLNVKQFEADFQALKSWYGDNINELVPKWEALVQRQTLASGKGANEQLLIKKQLDGQITALTDKTEAHETAAKKATAEAVKKANAQSLQHYEAAMNRRIELDDSSRRTRIAQLTSDAETMQVTEMQKVTAINKLELDSLEKRKLEASKYLTEVIGNADKEAEARHRLKLLDDEITQQKLTNADREREARKKITDELERHKNVYDDFYQSLTDQLDAIGRGGRAMSVYEQTLRDINRSQEKFSDHEKDSLLVIAQQIDAVTELNRQHAELKEFFSSTLRYVFDGDFKGLLRSITDRFKDDLIDRVSDSLATSFLGFNPKQTNNPVAKPIVQTLTTTNQILKSIADSVGARSFGIPGTSINLSGLGGFGGGGMGPGGTPYFNGNSGGMGPGGTPYFNGNGGGGLRSLLGGFRWPGDRTGTIDEAGNYVVDGRSWFSKLTGKGGFFGSQGFGNNVGTYGTFGALAGMLGGAVGGRAGSTISMAGQGLSIGAMLGSAIPGLGTAVGAAVGAGVGALIGFLGFSDPKRKQDKQENMPRLQQGFSDATEKLSQILADLRSLNGDPDALLAQAREVRSQMASGFGIQMLSKKYRKQATSLIASQLAAVDREPDGLMAQIIKAAGIARGAADRSKRILPEFASGVFIDPQIWHPNGLLPGVFDGRDDIIARLTKGEMVLNPMQQARARKLAGFDVFAGAGIPNYPNASSSPAMATGGIAGRGLSMPSTVVQPQFTLELSGVTLDEKVEAYLTSDKGVRTQIAVTKTLKKRGDI